MAMHMDKNNYWDMHVHTHFAYCSESNMMPADIVSKIGTRGMKGLAFTEHAAQLYVSLDDYWSARFINEPHLIGNGSNNRLPEYMLHMSQFKSDNVKIGLEVDLDTNGRLTLADADRSFFDILLGAVHWIPSRFDNNYKKGFLWAIDAFIDAGIQVLAHPFRVFNRPDPTTAVALHQPVINRLKHANMAVELNFHHNKPSQAFIKNCLAEGIKISLGSDSHTVADVGQMDQHFNFLEQICIDSHLEVNYYDPDQT